MRRRFRKLRSGGAFLAVIVLLLSAGVLAAIGELDYLEQTRALIVREREFLIGKLREAGVTVFPSDANFLLFRSEPVLAGALLREGIMIRTCGDFEGLDERYYRVAVRTRPENEVLVREIRRRTHG